MKYEYKILLLSLADAEKGLTKLSSDGWELVALYDVVGGQMRAVLKRPVGDHGLLGVE